MSGVRAVEQLHPSVDPWVPVRGTHFSDVAEGAARKVLAGDVSVLEVVQAAYNDMCWSDAPAACELIAALVVLLREKVVG